MGIKEQKDFADAVVNAKSTFFEDWAPAVTILSGLSMADMLASLGAIGQRDHEMITKNLEMMSLFTTITKDDARRIEFAMEVVENREIKDLGIPDEQVNDGREFLGCTRLDEAGVKTAISSALTDALVAITGGRKGTEWAAKKGDANRCCGVLRVAWVPILVGKRRAAPGASLIANLAAAAHYMLARFHVCAALSSEGDMRTVIDGYDAKKRLAIATGDPDLSSIALTSGNRPFPPDFAIRQWAYKGAADGNADRRRCNAKASPPFFPKIDGSEK